MTARQPGEGRQGAKVSPATGTMWRTTAQPMAAFLDLPSAPGVQGEIPLGKTRRKAEQYEILLSGEFYGAVDTWTEYLCLARNPDGSITLTSRARQILAEAGRYKERGWLPATIRRKEVWGYDGDYVVGQRLLPHDGDAELTVSRNQFDVAAGWLTGRKWDRQPEFGEAWASIRSALYGPEFFSLSQPLRSPTSIAIGPLGEENLAATNRGCTDAGTPPQPGGHPPREIVIRCAGPSKPWFIWLELIFIEWSKTSYSVYARTGGAVPGNAESSGLMPPVSGRLNWREVLQFVQSHNTAVSPSDPRPIDIYGVRPWQRDVIAAAMMRLSTMVPFLARLPEKELRLLHERLGGFLSQRSIHLLSRLAAVTSGLLVGHKSLTGIAQLVGSSDSLDIARLAEDCAAYRAGRDAEQVLAKHRDAPTPPPKLFLSLLDSKQPCPRLCAGLFELWLRAEPKPKGGRLPCGSMDDELPVLHWLLREQAAEILQDLAATHEKALAEFVSWFLGKARPYTGYFTGGYKFGSFNMYAFGRPRYAAWARLAQEVQDAAASLGIPFPESLRLPEMPDLEKSTQASLVTSSTGISPRHLKRMAEQLSVREPGKRDSDS
jgi:hypothetical protein